MGNMYSGIKPWRVHKKLPEPMKENTLAFIAALRHYGIQVKTKYLPWEADHA